MDMPRLYADLAWLWPVLSPPGDYVSEAATIDAILIERLGEGPKRVLELGAGGGHTLVHLLALGAERSKACGGWGGEHTGVAVDLSEAMLERCRALIPGVDARLGDMRDVRLGERFDAVLIHDAVDYLLTEADVRRTLATVREHLLPGGLALIAPTYVAETFEAGDYAEDVPEPDAYGGAVLAAHGVSALSYSTRLGDVSDDGTFAMTLTYRIFHADGRLETAEDRHRCGLFAEDAWLAWMEQVGLPAERFEQGAAGDGGAWTLFVGRARG
ncbi:MAG: class I SAM-dependent methyltransferase [Planctomycetota bacterium]